MDEAFEARLRRHALSNQEVGQLIDAIGLLEDSLAEAECQRDMAEAYMKTLAEALNYALARGKFEIADALKLKAALRQGDPVA